MTQNSIGSYTVEPREVVTIDVVASKVNEFVEAALDGTPLNPIGNAPVRFQFTVTKQSGETHFVVIECHFDATAPDDAQYQIFVQGSLGGGRFADFTILKTDPDWSRTLNFRVSRR